MISLESAGVGVVIAAGGLAGISVGVTGLLVYAAYRCLKPDPVEHEDGVFVMKPTLY